MSNTNHPQHAPVRPGWLSLVHEAPLAPEQKIIDTHHHLYDRAGLCYLLDAYLADIASGHAVIGSVYVQARSMLRADGPEAFRPVGETEFANGVAAMSASGLYGTSRICAGIVSFADLSAGAAVRPVLEAHIAAAGGTTRDAGRFCGIRQPLVWDADRSLMNAAYVVRPDMMESQAFLDGFAVLDELSLTFDAWAYFHQLPQVAALAARFPETQFVLDHCGGLVGVGSYAGRGEEVMALWSRSMSALAERPNVSVKIGGLGMRLSGFGFEAREQPPNSTQVAEAWGPVVRQCIDIFTPARCMLESNFPVDKSGLSYGTLWNAFKRLTAAFSQDERDRMFWQNAATVYGLDPTGFFGSAPPRDAVPSTITEMSGDRQQRRAP
jgi:predicted TIM-barrel fold metal-dependent hydrolase